MQIAAERGTTLGETLPALADESVPELVDATVQPGDFLYSFIFENF